MRNLTATRRRGQHGATLIEVLVSILLLSLGVLAMAAMQANAVQYGKTSEFRAMATMLANDLADRVRANDARNLNDPKLSMSVYNLKTVYSKPSKPSLPDKVCTGNTTCQFAEMAAYDLAQWRQSVYSQLPEGTAYVNVTPNASSQSVADIWIAWTDPGSASNLGEGATDVAPQVDACPKDFKAPATVRCMYFHIVL